MKNILYKDKRAVEMSLNFMVVLVLIVVTLIGAIFLIQKIFSVSKGVVDMTEQQLRNEISKLFSEEDKVSIYPGTRYVEIKQGNVDGVGLGIRNLLQGAAGDTSFSYTVSASDVSNCGTLTEANAESWIIAGKSEENIAIASGDFSSQVIRFEIPVGAPLCTARFRVNVFAGGSNYKSDSFDIKVRAK